MLRSCDPGAWLTRHFLVRIATKRSAAVTGVDFLTVNSKKQPEAIYSRFFPNQVYFVLAKQVFFSGAGRRRYLCFSEQRRRCYNRANHSSLRCGAKALGTPSRYRQANIVQLLSVSGTDMVWLQYILRSGVLHIAVRRMMVHSLSRRMNGAKHVGLSEPSSQQDSSPQHDEGANYVRRYASRFKSEHLD